MKSLLMILAGAALLSAGLAPAHAADAFPVKPIRLVVGYAPGGPTDVIARIIAKDMSIALGQTVFVENKAGASSMIATREVKGAPADGYTLLMSSLVHNVNPILLGAQAGYNPKTDFAPIANAVKLPMVAVNGYDAPVRTMQELLAKARSKPEAVSFGSSGNGGSGHLTGELLGTLAKAKMLHVPYKGNGPALMEVMAGRVDFMFYPVVGIAEHVATKRVRILATGTATRLAQFPDTPTMSEVGFPGFEETASWVGMFAPARTPPAVVQSLNQAMLKALSNPQVKVQMEKLGAFIVGDSPAEFTSFLERDYDRWEQVIKAADIKPQPN